MTYLIAQTFFGLIIAFLLGLLIGWLAVRSAYKKESAEREAEWDKEKEEIKTQSEQPMRKLLGELDAINSRYTDHLDGKAIIDMESDPVALATDNNAQEAIGYNESDTTETNAVTAVEKDSAAEENTDSEVTSFSKPENIVIYQSAEDASQIDDLKTINGIGPKFETVLNGVGIYSYAQIAAWGEDEINWITQEIEDQTDRIRRDNWVKQAKDLA